MNKKNNNNKELKPFAIIDEVFLSSPAEKCHLLIGDEILSFGNVTYENNRELKAISDVVISNINNVIKVNVLRKINDEFKEISLELIPSLWSGKGYLGY